MQELTHFVAKPKSPNGDIGEITLENLKNTFDKSPYIAKTSIHPKAVFSRKGAEKDFYLEVITALGARVKVQVDNKKNQLQIIDNQFWFDVNVISKILEEVFGLEVEDFGVKVD